MTGMATEKVRKIDRQYITNSIHPDPPETRVFLRTMSKSSTLVTLLRSILALVFTLYLSFACTLTFVLALSMILLLWLLLCLLLPTP